LFALRLVLKRTRNSRQPIENNHSLTHSTVKEYSDLALVSAEHEHLLFTQFTALLEKSKAQQNDDRVDQATTKHPP
uniref:Secreted protein n=1 Tax=Taenia asiatica TaxID=60517 RepID=A0A0R3VVD1_TAEAS